MKNLIYTKEECTLCKGTKEMQVSLNDYVLYVCGQYMVCPLCNGSGYLSILNVENKNSLIKKRYK